MPVLSMRAVMISLNEWRNTNPRLCTLTASRRVACNRRKQAWHRLQRQSVLGMCMCCTGMSP